MRKIRLEPDTLTVDSFVLADAQPTERGTVHANGFASRNCPATGMTFCETNCDCTLGCPSVGPCTQVA